MIHWAKNCFWVSNCHHFQYSNIGLEKESYFPLFKFGDKDVDAAAQLSSPSCIVPYHVNDDWPHAV